MKKILVNEMNYAIIPTISGEDMKKLVEIRMTDLLEKQSEILYKGVLEIETQGQNQRLSYLDTKHDVTTNICFMEEGMRITRTGAVESDMLFQMGEVSEGWLETPYGRIYLDIRTNKYIVGDRMIAMEYGLYNGDDMCGSFRFLMRIKEVDA